MTAVSLTAFQAVNRPIFGTVSSSLPLPTHSNLSCLAWLDQRHLRSGLAFFSSGSPWEEDSPDVSGPSNVTMCVFERNNAVDGGGMYSAAGYDMINDTLFEDNLAGMTMKNA